MNHHDHVRLIRDGVSHGDSDDAQSGAPIWADIGSGGGAFTLALADLLGDGVTIHSVDRDARALREQERALHAAFPSVSVVLHAGDFTRPLDLPPLDGIVMANALHFVRDQTAVVARLRAYLKPGGRFVLVEYDADRGNYWVPHPLSFRTWEALAPACDLTRRACSRPCQAASSAQSTRRVATSAFSRRIARAMPSPLSMPRHPRVIRRACVPISLPDDRIARRAAGATPRAVISTVENTEREAKWFRYGYCKALRQVRRNDVVMVQAALVIFFSFGALLALLFVALVAGVAAADRARVPVV